MTAPAGGSAAAVWVSVLPDLSNFGATLTREVAGVGGNAGERIGQDMGRSTETTFAKAAKGIAAAGAVIGGAVGLALVGAMNVEAANDKLSAQLGLTAKDAERYGKVAGDLYSSNYGDSLETVNEALRQVTLNVGATATSSDADLRRITASVLDVATAFDQDLGGTAAAVGQLMKTGLATDAGQALDIITVGFQKGADKAGDFLDTLNEYGGQFQKLGLDGATATGIITQGLQAGARDADLVADAIKEFSIRAIDGSAATGEGFKALGLDGAEMARKIAAGGPQASGALDLVLDRLRAMPDPVQRSQAAVALFGTQAEDLGAALFALDPSSAVAALGQVEGAAGRMGSTLADNAGANLEAFKRQAITAFVDIVGGQVLPILTAVASFLATNFGPALAAVGGFLTDTVIPAFVAFGGFLDQNRTAVTIIAAVIAAVFLPGLIALGATALATGAGVAIAWVITQAAAIAAAVTHSGRVIAMIAGWVLLGAQSLVQAARVVLGWVISSAGAIAAGVVYVFQVAIMVGAWVLLGVQSLLGAARVAAAWLIAMGPIGLVIIAVVGLVALIIANWDTIAQVTEAVFKFIGDFIVTTWDSIVTIFNTSVAFIVGLWNGFWSGVQQVATTVWNAVSGFIATVWAAIQLAFNTAVSFLRALWDTWWAGLRLVADTVFTAIRVAVDFVWGLIQAGFQAAVDFIRALWDTFWNVLRTVADTVFNAIKAAIDFVWDAIKDGFSAAVTFVSDLWDGFWSGLSTVASTVFNAIKGTIDTVIGGIVAAFEFVVQKVGEIWAGIKRLLAIPINFMIGTVYNDGIVKAWNFVAGLLGIGGITPLPLIPEFREGGRVPGRPNDEQLAKLHGNEHVWTDEEVRGAGGHAAVEKLRANALTPRDTFQKLQSGRLVEGADHEGPGISTSGFGGVKSWVAASGHLIQQMFGVGSIGGVGSRPGPSDHPSGHALDFMTYSDRGLGDRVAGHLLSNAAHHAIKYLIWQQRINSGSGWRQMEDRGSVTANHFDHVHASYLDNPAAGTDFSGGGAGGGFINFILEQVRGLYNGVTDPIPGLIAGLVGNPPPRFREIPPAMAANAIKAVGDFLFGKAAAVDAASGADGTGVGNTAIPAGRDGNVTAVRANAAGYGWSSGTQWDSLVSLINSESGFNNTAQNPTSTAYGMYQFLNSTWGTVGGSKTSDPGLQALYGNRYVAQRYGDPAAAWAFHKAHNYYDDGGLAVGQGLLAKYTREPERVLSPRQTVAFERLVDHLDGTQSGNGNPVQGAVERKLDQLIGAHHELAAVLRSLPFGITVEDRSGDPVATARATQLALRTSR